MRFPLIKILFFKVITIGAVEVTQGPNRLEHQMKGIGRDRELEIHRDLKNKFQERE
jgi:hypothetical protein